MLKGHLYENEPMFSRWVEDAGARPERAGSVVREMLAHVAYIAVADMELVARGGVSGADFEAE